MNKENSIYRTPGSELLKKEKLPEIFVNGSLSSRKLNLLAWLTLFYLFLSFPTFAISFMSGFEPGNEMYSIVAKALTFISMIILIYLFMMFKKFLNLRFEFSSADKLINILIGMSIIMAVLSLFMGEDSEELDIATIIYFILLVPFGIVTVLFGKKLLSISVSFSYLKLYSWTTIITGVCLASVIFFLLALPLSIISDIAMALMYFSASKEVKSARAIVE